MSAEVYRCGYVAIVGRPNVGKSTLMNRILGQKISITSSKPQTTRHRIIGIKTADDHQAVYVDTPGMHSGARAAINRYMNRAATQTLHDVHVIVFMIDAGRWTDEDEAVLERLREVDAPVILVLNKVDKFEDRAALLPLIQAHAGRHAFADIVPLCAKNGDNLAALEACVARLLPQSDPYYPEDQVTDRSQRFLAAELVREKLFRQLGQELPYATTVEIESFKEKDGVLHIHAVIWVARPGQKAIVIGKQGAMLKEIGRKARIDMERLFDAKVFLQLWVKVKEGWADDERALRSFGYTDEP